MLKLLLMIECDLCGGVLMKAASAENPHAWSFDGEEEHLSAKIHDLQLTAEESSWQSMRNGMVHHCSDCSRG